MRRRFGSDVLPGRVTLAVLAAVLATASARAETPAASAGTQFERGYVLAREGDFEAAAVAFETAYALSPNFSVLFNLGQAYGAAGHAVEAARSLDRYLELGGTAINDEQRQKVALLISHYRRRIGWLKLQVEPSGASAELDGKPIGSAPFTDPVEVSAGLHGLSFQLPGHESVQVSVRITGGQTSSSETRLLPREELTLLRLECPLPDVLVRFDQRELGATPLPEALQLPSGSHELSLTRAGYRAQQLRVLLVKGKLTELRCDLPIDPSASRSASLRIEHPKGTHVAADGRPFNGERLPEGRHAIVVAGPGFEPVQHSVRLIAGTSASLTVIAPKASTLLERESANRAKTQKVASYVLAGAAVVSGTAAAILAITNQSRYSAWRAKDEHFLAEFASAPPVNSARQLDQLLSEENSIRKQDSIALGLGIAAGMLMAASVGLYVTAGDKRPALIVTGRSAAWVTSW